MTMFREILKNLDFVKFLSHENIGFPDPYQQTNPEQ